VCTPLWIAQAVERSETAVRQALRPVVGAETVAARFAAIGQVTNQGVEPADMNAELVGINGGPGMVFSGLGRVISTVTFDFDADGRITTITTWPTRTNSRPSLRGPLATSARSKTKRVLVGPANGDKRGASVCG
jgi:RNA polymerase sigma-70 factor (ECF subfamily)